MENKKIKIPYHTAIIVDGNGRWAQKRGLNRSKGHEAGAKRVEEIIGYAIEKGISVISLYVFSTENFKRDKKEVQHLMQLIQNNLKKMCHALKDKNIRILFSGREKPLSSSLLQLMRQIEKETETCTQATVNFCLNYGGQAEIVDACKKLLVDVQNKKINIQDIDTSLFENYLYHPLPPVDFVIRTSGEERLSNFLLWQTSYAELYFPETLFPDFDKKEFDKAIMVYNKRNRRFGGTNS